MEACWLTVKRNKEEEGEWIKEAGVLQDSIHRKGRTKDNKIT